MQDILKYVGFSLMACGMVGSCFFSIDGRRQAGRLAEWLYSNRNNIWLELGKPGTRNFKGEPNNSLNNRVASLNGMIRLMPLHQYNKYIDGKGLEYLINYQARLKQSIVCFFVFFIGLSILIACTVLGE